MIFILGTPFFVLIWKCPLSFCCPSHVFPALSSVVRRLFSGNQLKHLQPCVAFSFRKDAAFIFRPSSAHLIHLHLFQVLFLGGLVSGESEYPFTSHLFYSAFFVAVFFLGCKITWKFLNCKIMPVKLIIHIYKFVPAFDAFFQQFHVPFFLVNQGYRMQQLQRPIQWCNWKVKMLP